MASFTGVFSNMVLNSRRCEMPNHFLEPPTDIFWSSLWYKDINEFGNIILSLPRSLEKGSVEGIWLILLHQWDISSFFFEYSQSSAFFFRRTCSLARVKNPPNTLCASSPAAERTKSWWHRRQYRHEVRNTVELLRKEHASFFIIIFQLLWNSAQEK